MGAGDRRADEAGFHTPRTRPAPKDNQQSVTSLFLSRVLLNLLDRHGPVRGAIVCEPDEVIEHIRLTEQGNADE